MTLSKISGKRDSCLSFSDLMAGWAHVAAAVKETDGIFQVMARPEVKDGFLRAVFAV